MYHIVKDVAGLITMSSENHFLTALSQQASHFQRRRLNTSKFGQLTCFTGHREHRQNKQVILMGYSWLVDPQQAGFMLNRNRISGMFVPNCMNIPK